MEKKGKNMSQLQLNTKLQSGKYVIKKVLGQGGFGITYLAEHTILKTNVAIKEFFIRDLCARDDSATVFSVTQSDMVDRYRLKFIKEAQIIACFNHPGIVKVSDTFEENGTVYYVMNYVEGENLDEIIKREGALPEERALGYITKVADALDYIHQHNVNHLDIKPSNIMIRRNDDEPILIDFGVSKQYDEHMDQTTTTPPGVSNGYSPLEQYRPGGVSTFSPQADIYALGATLYKMLTGNTPPNASDLLNSGLPPMPNGITVNVRKVIEKAMQFRISDRPKNTREWEEMMDRTINDLEEEQTKNISVSSTRTGNTMAPNFSEINSNNNGNKIQYKIKKFYITNIINVFLSVVLIFFGLSGFLTCIVELAYHSEDRILNYISIIASFGFIYWGAKLLYNHFRDIKIKTKLLNRLVANMRFVEGGTFLMGANQSNSKDSKHKVTLSPFWIGCYQVTQEEWELIMDDNPSTYKSNQKPVETVSWDDCQEFIDNINRITGLNFRLPTEAEWEYAARGGNQSLGYKYAGSNDINAVAWYWMNSGDTPLCGEYDKDKIQEINCQTHNVGMKIPNELGLYDMSGNVWEWCSDWFAPYALEYQVNPKGVSHGKKHVMRGGGFENIIENCEVSLRHSEEPSKSFRNVGLRLAL